MIVIPCDDGMTTEITWRLRVYVEATKRDPSSHLAKTLAIIAERAGSMTCAAMADTLRGMRQGRLVDRRQRAAHLPLDVSEGYTGGGRAVAVAVVSR